MDLVRGLRIDLDLTTRDEFESCGIYCDEFASFEQFLEACRIYNGKLEELDDEELDKEYQQDLERCDFSEFIVQIALFRDRHFSCDDLERLRAFEVENDV